MPCILIANMEPAQTAACTILAAVIAGLDPAIHEARSPGAVTKAAHRLRRIIMDARDKPAHDAEFCKTAGEIPSTVVARNATAVGTIELTDNCI